jgi:Flp pilus assembly pilin Flp
MLEFYVALVRPYVANVVGRLESERAQTTVEYALILALVVAMAVAAFTLTGVRNAITTALGNVANALTSALP